MEDFRHMEKQRDTTVRPQYSLFGFNNNGSRVMPVSSLPHHVKRRASITWLNTQGKLIFT